MKRTLWMLACALFTQMAIAQETPKWAANAKKAVFSIVTYDKDNNIKGTGNGFYIDTKGTALSDYSLFEGAERAVIINANGKELPVELILGANSMYDVVKFKTPTDKKQVSLKVASQPAKEGESVYLLPYSTQKEATLQKGNILNVDSIGNNSFYYTLQMKTGEKMVSCPIMNVNGEVVGMIQKNASEESDESYAIAGNYGQSLAISALSFNDDALNKIGIKKALPDTEEQALVYLYMSSEQLDEKSYSTLLNDFIQQYPNNHEGYIRRATQYVYGNDASQYPLADEDIKKAMELASNKEEAKFQVAKAIYTYTISLEGKEGYSEWNYERALNIVREAIQANNQPIYSQLEGDILYAQKKYADAYNCYDRVNKSPLASTATFYSAAKAKQFSEGSDINEVLALMDSAIVRLNKPYLSEAAPYFYERAELYTQAKKFREAVVDYNTFYKAVSGDVNALFYYQREQVEMQCRMYQQALDDINKAVELSADDEILWVEKGVVHLRVNQIDEAITALEKAVSLNAEYAAAYRMLGYCQAKKGMKKEAKANYEKAKALGDTVVEQLIEKL
ncbi:MAG: serine protease [Bacteroidaceae bacterium]|nr:serine protease [Bacteroidaceae bacterium]